MAFGGVTIPLAVEAGVDLSDSQYYCVSLLPEAGTLRLGNVASGGIGVLQNAPVTGREAAVTIVGESLAQVSGRFNYGAPLAPNDNGVLVSVQVAGASATVAFARDNHASDTPSLQRVFVIGPAARINN